MKTTINFTENEKQVIRNYFSKGINLHFQADNVMSFYELSMSIFMNEGVYIHIDTLKGVVGSLTKKNIFECEDYDGNGSNMIYPSTNFNWTKESYNEIMLLVK